jgi:purine-binding chemotaxis protein CheW
MSATAERTVPAHAAVATSTELQLATFWLEDLLLGINIHDIRGINRVGTITPVPDAPEMVAGVVNLRGDVVTVVNLRSILQLPLIELTPKARLLVVESEAESIGLLVDRVADVATVLTDHAEPLPANFNTAANRYLTHVYRLGAELLVMLNVSAALAGTEN